MRKCLVLDIETANLDMDAEGLVFDNPKGWITSCVGIYDIWEGENEGVHYYYVGEPNKIMTTELQEYNLRSIDSLVDTLTQCYDTGYYIVTKNGKGFDLPILSKTLENGGAGLKSIIDKYETDNRHIDICMLLREQYGYRFSLQNLVKGLYGEQESKTMNAAHAPEAWADGKYQEVLDYCMHDCVLTAKVFFDAPHRKFEAVGYNGQRSKKHQIKVNW
jgi:DNA polymerase elongation subunit (family B)